MKLEAETVERLHAVELTREFAGFEDDFASVWGGHGSGELAADRPKVMRLRGIFSHIMMRTKNPSRPVISALDEVASRP
ncbi:MAG TPA: hypothetical protein DDZ88_28945 [Verrucomicrobiales bacterium]|nr:hypothetical protein [Verrucomicrobiales bacterium]